MTQLLVSVRDAAEARTAVEGGADLIDIKEPARGPLGAADVDVVEQIIAEVAGRRPVSAALGELRDWRPLAGRTAGVCDTAMASQESNARRGALSLRESSATFAERKATKASSATFAERKVTKASSATSAEGKAAMAFLGWPRFPHELAFAKLGMAGCGQDPGWQTRWRTALREFPAAVGPVAVVYADWRLATAPAPEAVIASAIENRCRAVLVDTFDKRGGNLLDWLTVAELGQLVASVRRSAMLVVLAGSLSLGNIRPIRALEPDYVAVRGAVCRGGRLGTVDAQRVGRLARAVRGVDQD